MKVTIDLEDKDLIEYFKEDELYDLAYWFKDVEWLEDNIASTINNCPINKVEIEGFESFKEKLKETVFEEHVKNLKDNLEW